MLKANISNTWKNIKYGYVNINNSWKKLKNIYVNISGVWKPLWSYSWYIGDWSDCSAECGGGIQTRTVYCKRNDNVQVDDVFCSGTKPSTQQSCNTQSCGWPIGWYESSLKITNTIRYLDTNGTQYSLSLTIPSDIPSISGMNFANRKLYVTGRDPNTEDLFSNFKGILIYDKPGVTPTRYNPDYSKFTNIPLGIIVIYCYDRYFLLGDSSGFYWSKDLNTWTYVLVENDPSGPVGIGNVVHTSKGWILVKNIGLKTVGNCKSFFTSNLTSFQRTYPENAIYTDPIYPSIVSMNDQFVGWIQYNGSTPAKVATSSDGINWVAKPTFGQVPVTSVAYGNGYYVTTGYGRWYYTTDLVNWGTYSLGNDRTMSVSFHNVFKKFILSRYNEGVLYLTDNPSQIQSQVPTLSGYTDSLPSFICCE